MEKWAISYRKSAIMSRFYRIVLYLLKNQILWYILWKIFPIMENLKQINLILGPDEAGECLPVADRTGNPPGIRLAEKGRKNPNNEN